jgi:hypothetical protein
MVDPNLKSYRILYDFEKESIISEFNQSKIPIYTIPHNNRMCIELGAKINDIICIKSHITLIYRRVI